MDAEPVRLHYNASPEDVALLKSALPDSEPIGDMLEFEHTLRQVGEALPQAGLPGAFNYVYWHLTRGTRRAARGEYNDEMPYPVFDMPDKIEKTAGIFGEFYFRQLRSLVRYAEGDQAAFDEVSQSWQISLLHPDVQCAGNDWKQFIAGMKTHIESELAPTLKLSGLDEDYYGDYTHGMHRLFHITSHDIAPVLVPGHLPHGLKRAVAVPVLGHIANIRETSWHHSYEIAEPDTPEFEADIDTLDIYTANRIEKTLRLGRSVTRLAAAIQPIEDSRAVDWTASYELAAA